MEPNLSRKPLVVVAGQAPPPVGGQNVMIRRILKELEGESMWQTKHLEFFFTPSFQTVRRFQLSKVRELFSVWIRWIRLIVKFGRPDLVIYPAGGPQTVPILRDILLLPLICAWSRSVVVQFHAAGIAERLKNPGLVTRILQRVFRQVQGAIVMAAYNRCDPEALQIARIEVIPHRLPDENPTGRVPSYEGFPHEEIRLLYAGHLYADKGTPQLIEGFALVAREFPKLRLVLMGEYLSPYSHVECLRRCSELGVANLVEYRGILHGEEKAATFASSHLFVFPSVAPYESFGLVLVEAMMWGLPIVASKWRGNADVAGPDAVYADPADDFPVALAQAIRGSLFSPKTLFARALAARKRYETHFRLSPNAGDYRAFVSSWLAS